MLCRPVPALVAVASFVLVACADGSTASEGGASPRPGHAVVTGVSDGDTIRVTIDGRDERIRLIGVDTPEVHGPGGLRECFGQEASRHTKRLLPRGTEVRLVRDVEARDRYGRLLAYVYRADGTFVNLALAAGGYAAPLTLPPNVAHRDEIAGAAADARDAGLGLWAACGGPDTPERRLTQVPSPP